MSPETQLDQVRKTEILSPEVREIDERFTNIGINLVVLILVVVAYIPLLLDPEFYTASLSRQTALIGLGLLYLFNGTYGMTVHERHLDQVGSSIIYFTLQIGITMSLLFISQGLNSSLWLLILPVAAQSLALYSWAMTMVISAILLGGIWYFFLRDQALADSILDLLGIGSSLVFTLIFTYIAVRETVTRQKIENLAIDLRQANFRLSQYATQVEELATTKERNRLASEIHDNLGHYLTVINVQIEVARTVLDVQPQKAQDALAKAQKLTQDGLSAVRQSVSTLRESPLGGKTLIEAIKELVAETQTGGIETSLKMIGAERPLDSKIALTLYRVAQEGLTNVRKHAGTANTAVTLDFGAPNEIRLVVEDDGAGAENIQHTGFGLIGTAERVRLVGGEMEIHTSLGEGWVLSVVVPTPAS